MDRNKLERIVKARLALKQRFEEAMRSTPSLADDSPLGSGAPNRHGMPRLPVGQTETHKWPVLDLGIHPEIAPERWALQVDGACSHPIVLRFSELYALDQVEERSEERRVGKECRSRWWRDH